MNATQCESGAGSRAREGGFRNYWRRAPSKSECGPCQRPAERRLGCRTYFLGWTEPNAPRRPYRGEACPRCGRALYWRVERSKAFEGPWWNLTFRFGAPVEQAGWALSPKHFHPRPAMHPEQRCNVCWFREVVS